MNPISPTMQKLVIYTKKYAHLSLFLLLGAVSGSDEVIISVRKLKKI